MIRPIQNRYGGPRGEAPSQEQQFQQGVGVVGQGNLSQLLGFGGGMNQNQAQNQQNQQQQQLQNQNQNQSQGLNQNLQPGNNNAGPSNTAAGATGVDGQSNAASGAGGSGAPEMNLAGVLHYLQSEWRRWERDRNEWEIERAEMRARIALLEGQRRSAENLKVDLLRRVKMLEYALRQERTRTMSTLGKASSAAPSRLTALQDEDKASSRDEREGSGSEGSEEGSHDRPKVNGIHPAAMGKASTISIRQQDNVWKNISSVPKDPKSRARSREYLKQCLQEVTYLTSPGALNPLPSGAPISIDKPPSPTPSSPDGPEGSQRPKNPEPVALPDRPRKVLPEHPPPSQFQKQSSESAPGPTSSTTEDKPHLPNGLPKTDQQGNPSSPVKSTVSVPPPKAEEPTAELQPPSTDTSSEPPSSPAPKPIGLPEDSDSSETDESNSIRHELSPLHLQDRDRDRNRDSDTDSTQGDENHHPLTAIYKPESKAAWREELRAASEKADKVKAEKEVQSQAQNHIQSDEEQLASLSLHMEDESTKGDDASSGVEKVWSTKRNLKSHLDIVRAVDFAHGPNLMLVSGGDDCTVKVWSLDAQSIMSNNHPAGIEPIMTYRGHTSPITSIVVSSAHGLIFSASIDSTIRLWKIPPPNHDPYAPYDSTFTLQTLEGHTDSIWDICLLPPTTLNGNSSNGNGKKPDGRLVSASSDGSIRLWVSEGSDDQWRLKGTWRTGGNPTCLGVCQGDYGKVLVGMADGTVKLWDVGEGKVLESYGEVADGTDGQVNAVLSHPTLPAILTAHEDGHVRFFDLASSSPTPTYEILAHPSPVTSLSLSPRSPAFIFTASADCTLRLWDITRKQSIQDLQGHRKRSEEGVNAVASHPELPIIASAGADGIVRVWTCS